MNMRKEQDAFVRAAYAADAPEADQMVELLKENGIMARKQGGIRDIYMGGAAVGEEIMVPREQEAEAAAVLKEFQPIRISEPEQRKLSREERANEARNIMSWLFVAVVVLMIIFPMVVSLLSS